MPHFPVDLSYKLQENGVKRLSDGAFIPEAPGNRDWREFQEWLDEGNIPEPRFTPEEQAEHDRQQAIVAERQRIRELLLSADPPPTSLVGLKDRIINIEIALGLRDPEV